MTSIAQKTGPVPDFPSAAQRAHAATMARGNLHAYAAGAAVLVLCGNWVDATAHGYTPDQLIPDVDDVIEELRDFQRRLRSDLNPSKSSNPDLPLPPA